MDPVTLKLAPGFFSEQTDRGAVGRWKTGDRVRFKDSLPQKMGGWLAQTLTGVSTFHGIDRKDLEWTSLDGQPWVAQGTSQKLYISSRGVRYDITPVRRTITLTNPFTTTLGSALVAVADTAHGAQEGDFVRFSGATAVGGLTIDGEYQITSVQSGNKYTITAAGTAGASATGGGSPVANYDINIGYDSTIAATGYGTGPYGRGAYGTARATASANIKNKLRTWSLANWGEDLIASPQGGAVYWWDRSQGPNTRAVILDNAPITNEFVMVSNSGDQIICLGAYDESAGNKDPMLIRTGDIGSLTDFTIDPAGQNNVFEERLSTGSRIICGIGTRGGILIFTDLAVYLMQPDPDNVYRVGKIAEGNVPAGPNAAVDANGTVVLMALNKFMKYDGVYSELPCDVWGMIFDNADSATPGFDTTQPEKVYCWFNKAWGEIWWHYPSLQSITTRVTPEGDTRITSTGATRKIAGATGENDRYVIYNIAEGIWYFGTIVRTAMAAAGPSFKVPFGSHSDGTFFLHETGTDDNTSPMNEYIESYDVQIGDGPYAQHIAQFIPDMKRLVGTFTLTLKAKNRPQQATYVTFGPYNFTSADTLVGTRAAGRQIAVRFSSGALGTDWRLGAGTFEGQQDASR